MSVEGLMTQQVTVLTQTGIAQSGTGEGIRVFDDGVTTLMYLQPGNAEEQEAERNTPIGDWTAIAKADEVISSTSRVIYGIHTFDVIGEPQPATNPMSGVVSHQKLLLQEVT